MNLLWFLHWIFSLCSWIFCKPSVAGVIGVIVWEKCCTFATWGKLLIGILKAATGGEAPEDDPKEDSEWPISSVENQPIVSLSTKKHQIAPTGGWGESQSNYIYIYVYTVPAVQFFRITNTNYTTANNFQHKPFSWMSLSQIPAIISWQLKSPCLPHANS